MFSSNEKMNVLLEQEKSIDILSIKQLCYKISSKIKCINDCVLYDNNGILDNDKINWDYVLKLNYDLTGYEVSCNEIVIPDNIFCKNGVNVFLDELKKQLSEKLIDRKICFIMYYNGIGVLRFHTYRPDEGMWLDSVLENYQEAVLYYID